MISFQEDSDCVNHGVLNVKGVAGIRAKAARPSPVLTGVKSEREIVPEASGEQEIEPRDQEQGQPSQVPAPGLLQDLHRRVSILWRDRMTIAGTHAKG